MENLNDISYKIIGAAFKVHKNLGPGLLESAYETCLEYELRKIDLKVERQKVLSIMYEDQKLDAGYRLDLVVNNKVIIELKAISKILPIHKAQTMTYLKLSGIRLGLLLNFNVMDMKQGINRIIM